MVTVDHLPGRTLQPVAVALVAVFVVVAVAAVAAASVLTRRLREETARAEAALA
jgi:hypothetical protein